MTIMAVLPILAQLFQQPMEVPTRIVSLLWALPICMSISLVYKAIKLDTFKPATYLREVMFLFGTIIGFLILVAVVLLVIAEWVR